MLGILDQLGENPETGELQSEQGNFPVFRRTVESVANCSGNAPFATNCRFVAIEF
jgi:hypothetical protein